jgi:glycosyltransferase involved in cell wall biosynthesis
MNENPLFFAPRLSKSSTHPIDFFARWAKYSQKMSSVSKGEFTSINMVVRLCNTKSFAYESIQSDTLKLSLLDPLSKGFFRDSVAFWRVLKNSEISPNIVIAGDNYFGFLVPYIYRFISRSRYRIQISIHHSLKPIFRNEFNPIRFIKYIGLRRIVSLADSIRTVSIENRKYLINNWRVPPFKIIVAPIPLVIPVSIPQEVEAFSIGFLGRMHPERGLETWMQIIEKYSRSHHDIKVILAGEGTMRKNFLSGLSSILPEKQITYFGNLSASELEAFWKTCSVLLSTAEEESYGMSIREAVLNGRKVVAKSNSGTREVQRIFPGAIYLFSSEEEAIKKLDEAFDTNLTVLEVDSYRRYQSEEDQRSLESLVESWL